MLAIVNGKVCTITGQVFDKGNVLIEDGKIKEVGPKLPIPEMQQ